jgi:hypothetical protein
MVMDLSAALDELRRNPGRTVVADAGGILVELRVASPRSADDIFREIGRWEGESPEKLAERLRRGRALGGSHEPPLL